MIRMTDERTYDATKPELVKFDIDGAEVAVRLTGDRKKPALLLIHGFPASSRSFRKVIDPLKRDCFVVAPDLPGFGSSEPNPCRRMRHVNGCIHQAR